MIKINYEINGSLKDLKEKYIQTFIGKGRNKGNQSNTDFNNNFIKSIFNDNSITFQKLLIADFEGLLNIQKRVGKIISDQNELSKLKEIFDYDGVFQRNYISPFFEEHIKPTTCYYCNIDFINVFGKYNDVFDFLNHATEEELKLSSIGKEKQIIKQREKRKFEVDGDLEIIPLNREEMEKVKRYFLDEIIVGNGFTLDHVFDKGKYPYFALSLFNLVPCCYICNSKLKGSKPIGDVSPSSEKFDFHEKVKFKTYFSTNNDKLLIEKQDDVEIYLKEYASEPTYKDYIEVFRLNERYRFHRYRVIEMIDKRKRYPDSRIQELAQLTGQTPMQVKKDLFGEYLFENDPKDQDLSKRPLAKLTRDIAEELGLI